MAAVGSEIVPLITTAATGFAAAVVQSAQGQAAEGVVNRGRALLLRVLRRAPEDPSATPDEAAAARSLGELPESDRQMLEAAVDNWIREGRLSDEALHRHIGRLCPGYPSAGNPGNPGTPGTPGNVSNTGITYGPNSPVIGNVGGNITFGQAPPDPGHDG